MTTFEGIPTEFAGARFRSRLEAKWAAFFTAMGWDWEYEPLDLDGYIPDFVLRFKRPMLVEVKPIFGSSDPIAREARAKIQNSGWHGQALLVGAGVARDEYGMACIGQVSNEDEDEAGNIYFMFGHASLHRCLKCGEFSIHDPVLSYRCRVNDCHDGDSYLGGFDADEAIRTWRQVSSTVQWKPR